MEEDVGVFGPALGRVCLECGIVVLARRLVPNVWEVCFLREEGRQWRRLGWRFFSWIPLNFWGRSRTRRRGWRGLMVLVLVMMLVLLVLLLLRLVVVMVVMMMVMTLGMHTTVVVLMIVTRLAVPLTLPTLPLTL